MKESESISSEMIHVLHHATGIPQSLKKPLLRPGWRNRYVCDETHDYYCACVKLVELGLMDAQINKSQMRGLTSFFATEKGLSEAISFWKENRDPVWEVSYRSLHNHDFYYGKNRSKAKAKVIMDIIDASGLSWIEAAKEIKSIKRFNHDDLCTDTK